jgi:hypothetical protein
MVTIAVPPLAASPALGSPVFVGAYVDGLRVDMQGGLVDLTPYITGMTITERMGSPDTLSLQLADLDEAIALAAIVYLTDIRVRLRTDYLFWGQIIVPTTETINYQSATASRTIDISAESYERFVPDALMSVLSIDSGRTMPDGSFSNTGGFSIGFGHTDGELVTGLFHDWWAGPSVDAVSCVHDTGAAPYIWQYPIDNTQLGSDLDAIAAAASVVTVAHWLDPRRRFHWVDGADPGSLDPAPFDISSVAFGWTAGTPPTVSTVMSMKMTNSSDAQNIRGRAYVQAALPWASGLVGNVGSAAPDVMISAGKAQTGAETAAFAARYWSNDNRIGFHGSASIPVGYDGWHKGQWVHVTDPGHELAAHGFLVQGVTARRINGADFEYDVDYGDAPRRSLASESANPTIEVQGPSVRYAMRTDPEQSSPTPLIAGTPPTGGPVTVIASLTDGIKQVPTSGIVLRWDLYIGGDLAADPTLTTQAYYLENATGTTNEQGQAITVAHTGSAFDPALNLSCTVEAVTEAPP